MKKRLHEMAPGGPCAWFDLEIPPSDRVVLVDRDGTLHQKAPEGNYISTREQVELRSDALDALHAVTNSAIPIVIVTNQGGVAKGLFSMDAVKDIYDELTSQLSSFGIALSGIVVCPHHPSVTVCRCRKPLPAMIEIVLEQFSANPSESVFIGDSETDSQTAQAASIRFVDVTDHIQLADLALRLVPQCDDLVQPKTS